MLSGVSSKERNYKRSVYELCEHYCWKNITFLNSPRNLAKDYSKWRTIAIEISDEDYQILSNPEIWDSNLMIKDFKGRRYWHNKASTMTANERKSTVYQSWQK